MMFQRSFSYFIVIFLLFNSCGSGTGGSGEPSQSNFAGLGEKIFFDTNLSSPKGQSCASCHNPVTSFSDPNHLAVSNGAVSSRSGTRNAPSIMYSLFSPVFGFNQDEGDYVGGQFHDGSALDLEAQAKRPLFGPNEMNLKDKAELRQRINEASYVEEFKTLYGSEVLLDDDQTLQAVANAISAFENSHQFRPFSSKYDLSLQQQATLTEQEKRGFQLFVAPNKGNCAACHPVTNSDGGELRALFTDFTYDNVGAPKNSDIKYSGVDIGLMQSTGRPSDIGRFKVPSLRNVAVTAPYFHNGVFKTLKEVVHFYNQRDIDPGIRKPEVPGNMNIIELGNLGLTSDEEDDIVAFLQTLTDGYQK